MRRRVLLGPSVALLIVTGSLAACGDDDSSSGDVTVDAGKRDGAVDGAAPKSDASSSGFDAAHPDATIPTDAGRDAGRDSGADAGDDAGEDDAGQDAGEDAGQDAGGDAGHDAGTPPPPTITLDITPECTTIADGFCNYFERCVGARGFALSYGDGTYCRSRVARECAKANVSQGATAYTSGNATTCANSLKAATCTMSPEAVLAGGACRRDGTLANAAACEVDEQCASGACDGTDTGFCGACVAKGKADEACTGENADLCEPGLSCLEGVCTAPVAAGAACPSGSSQECPYPQRCVDFMCGPALAAGADCTLPPGVDTFDGPCDANNIEGCSDAGKCVAVFQVAPAGGTCSFFSTFCRADEDCKFNAAPDDFNGVCQPLIKDGQACVANGGEPCDSPAQCVTEVGSICAVRNANRCQ